MATVREAFLAALDHHDAGRLKAAATLYGRIVAADSGHADEALPAFRTAIGLAPDNATYRSNAVIALRAIGRHDEAAPCGRSALALAPDHADALANLAAVIDDPAAALLITRRARRLTGSRRCNSWPTTLRSRPAAWWRPTLPTSPEAFISPHDPGTEVARAAGL